MFNTLSSSAVDRGFEHRVSLQRLYNWLFVASPVSTYHTALRIKRKDWLAAWNQNNVHYWNDMSTRGLLIQ
jgi:hypothetical protein